MSSKRPWMPLYIDDYLAGTSHLEAHEHGAYLLLMMRYWSKGSLPDDEELIRRVSRLSVKQWKESRETIKSFFLDGWRHERIDAEISKAIEKSKINSANASKSHDNRKPSAPKPRSERKANAPANADTLHTSHFTPPSGGREDAPPKAALQVGLGSQVDPEFEPSAEAIDRAHQQGATDEEIDSEVRKFIASHQIKGTFSPNWDASFAKWWENWKPHKERSKAPPRVEVNSGPFVPSETDWTKAIARWSKNESHWPTWGGNSPGSTSCKCPPEILRKHGIDPATGFKIKEVAE
jgi:uncharacterized protein YdaU (DUF1376 family)